MNCDLLTRAVQGDGRAMHELASGDWLDRQALAAALILQAMEDRGAGSGADLLEARALRVLDHLADEGSDEALLHLMMAGRYCSREAWQLARSDDALGLPG